jgi:hypothetical protein
LEIADRKIKSLISHLQYNRETAMRHYTPQPTESVSLGQRREWEARANARLELDSRNLDESSIVFKRNQAITEAYAEMYLRNSKLYKWAGMAALTSATVGRGMYIMRSLGQTWLGGMVGLFHREVAETFKNLGIGNLAVFKDIYWQHMAYEEAGLAELERVFRAGQLDRRALRGWRQIDAGRRTENADLVWQGNATLLHFEQKEVLQPQVYDTNPRLWKEIAGWVPTPIPGHRQSFEEFARGGNIAHFADRWAWIEQSMLPHWRLLADSHPAKVKRIMQSLMLGGDPLALPGLPMLRLRLGVYQAIGWRTPLAGWAV